VLFKHYVYIENIVLCVFTMAS